jgi:hypothetical protein
MARAEADDSFWCADRTMFASISLPDRFAAASNFLKRDQSSEILQEGNQRNFFTTHEYPQFGQTTRFPSRVFAFSILPSDRHFSQVKAHFKGMGSPAFHRASSPRPTVQSVAVGLDDQSKAWIATRSANSRSAIESEVSKTSGE